MANGRVRVTAEWALWGQASDHHGYDVLACSDGVFSRADFTAIIERYGSGTPDQLPQVTVGWAGTGADTHLTLAVQEWSGEQDRLGRDRMSTRLFCVPYAQLTGAPVGYEAFYEVFSRQRLPVDAPLTAEVDAFRPEVIAERVTEPAMATAALLLSRSPVCVVQGEAVTVLDRLRFLDTVVSLLPYGMRTRFTASTWTSSTSLHRIRLSFTRHGRDDAHTVVWGGPAELPPSADEPRAYLDLLKQAPEVTTMVRGLAMTGGPLDFRDSGPALDLLGDIVLGREPIAAAQPTVVAASREVRDERDGRVQREGRVDRDERVDRPAAREAAEIRPERSAVPLWPRSPGLVVLQALSSATMVLFVIALLMWLLS